MNEVAYRSQGANEVGGLRATGASQQPEEWTQRALAEMRRDMSLQLDAQLQQRLASRRGPSFGEATLAIGSLAVGAAITAILVNGSTTISSGMWGASNVSHVNTLPLVIVIWTALLLINIAWSRRR